MTRSAIFLIIALGWALVVQVPALNPTERTSISHLTYPSYTEAGVQIAVSFNVDYSIGSYRELWLTTAIGCGPNDSNCSSVSPNAVSSTPLECKSATSLANQSLLVLQSCTLPVVYYGSESFEYSFSFLQPGTYHLTALSQLNMQNNTNKIGTSDSASQTMTITVGSEPTLGSASTLSLSSTTETKATTTVDLYASTTLTYATSVTMHSANPATKIDYATLAYAVAVLAACVAGTHYLLKKRPH